MSEVPLALVGGELVDRAFEPIVAYPVFALWMLGGLVVYEYTGSRLGGVLVLPFLLFYVVSDPGTLLTFAGSTLVAYLAGEQVQRRTLIYGRRLLVAFLLLSLATSALLNSVLDVTTSGILMPVLPGLFAFNLHREGRPVWNSLAFFGWLLLFLVVTVAVVGVLRALA